MMRLPTLKNPHGVIQEMEDCNQGLAQLDHLWSRAYDAIDDAEELWAPFSVEATRWARAGAAKGATAAEIQARITEWVNNHPEAQAAFYSLRDARKRKAKLDRFMRSIEKRIIGAGTAQKGHDNLARYGGGTA